MVFDRRSAEDPDDPLELPCGKCIGCRLERSRQWAIRCVHEAKLHDQNCSITLTYDDEHLPADGSINTRDYQLFFKRLRKRGIKFRYFICGEYGENLGRPHYHACIFGFDFPDKKLFKTSKTGHRLYISEVLTETWNMGHALIGDLTFESAAYVARYITKKINGDDADEHYQGKKPEFITMSRRPGIGKGFFEKYKDDIFPNDFVVLNGKKMLPPKFYETIHDPFEMDDIKERRAKQRVKYHPDKTIQRLQVRENCKIVQTSLLKRNLEND
jgi:hypothetical protein